MKSNFTFVPLMYLIILTTKILCEEIHLEDGKKWPTVMVCVLARNKAHTLPYFLTLLSKQNYPKNRMALWIRSDHNRDETASVLKIWFNKFESLYHNVDLKINEGGPIDIPGETGPTHWSLSRFKHVISLRNECLNNARNIWADFVFMLDADAFLTDETLLQDLVQKEYTVVSPMLKSDSLYSNFWYGMTNEYYYTRTKEYLPTLYREEIGCFVVPMIHSAVLIDMRKLESDKLTYDPNDIPNFKGPYDDIIAFAVSANISDVPLHLCNTKKYGYIMTPLEQKDTLEMDDIANLKLDGLADESYITADPVFKNFTSYPDSDKMNFDKVYMINLERRPDRRLKMEESFKVLGLDATTLNAVDGRTLDSAAVKNWGIQFLPGYEDPYHNRPMTFGEIGCFLSHYTIWNEVYDKKYAKVMVLEDDIRFEPFFKRKLDWIMENIEEKQTDWDLIYLGRKRLQDIDELLAGRGLVWASYSYWTLGYLLSYSGAAKLLEAQPLKKLLPVDEYLPIMFDKHPNSSWSKHFEKRNLIAFSVSPLLVYPTHYTGQPGYISDTEASPHLHEL